MQTIRKISLSSAFKVGAILQTLLFLVSAIIMFVLQLLFFLLATIGAFSQGTDALSTLGIGGGLGIVFMLISIVIGVIVSLIIGGIAGFLVALMYNLTAGITGGLEVQIDD